MKFTFETTQNTRKYCMEVVECLKRYCGKSDAEAIRAVNTYWADEGTFSDLDFRLH